MERKLIEGDYVPDGAGGLTTLTGSEEVLARALYRLTARRAGCPFCLSWAAGSTRCRGRSHRSGSPWLPGMWPRP